MADSKQKVFLYEQSGKPVYGVKKFVVDDASGIEELPTDVHVGSSCLVIATGELYVINSQHTWVKMSSSSGESDGSSSEEAEALSDSEIQDIVNEVMGE